MKTKLPNTVCKAITKFYLRKTPEDLVQTLSQCKRYHCWTHKDLIKLAHIKADDPGNNILMTNICLL